MTVTIEETEELVQTSDVIELLETIAGVAVGIDCRLRVPELV